MDAVGGGGKPWLKPKALICYICGREFGTTSLGIHQKNCARLWEERENLKPKRERRPLPEPPKEIAIASSGKDNIDQFNDIAFNAFTSKSMAQCPNCARKFLEDRLVIHLRSCTSENPCKPVRSITSAILESPQKYQANSLPMTSQAKPPQVNSSSSALIKNPKKQSLIDKYLSEAQSKLQDTETPPSPEIKSKESTEILRSSSAFQSKDINEIIRPLTSQRNQEEPKISLNTMENFNSSPETEDNRIPCSKCGRKFNADRVGKHEEICKGDNQNWGKVKEDNKKVSKIYKLGNTNAKIVEESVECSYCLRNFDQKVAENHIPICKNTLNRPNPPKNTRSLSQNVITNKEKIVPSVSSNSPARSPDIGKIKKPLRVNNEKVYCHNCGERYFPNAKFCSFCGEKK
ncbi:unnamed protein product [Blepharisma stoltei]|uniref:C2HC/C3H-type domain-containing protein n=1 Tax=Blepharisma stoltei TaxID=1481888 RepID=A0AAU9IWL9_9CILI|nr:unnamed protein product [Blepharisma stoltei]